MKLYCPHCGVKGSAEDSFVGRKVKCPKCQGRFLVQPEMALGSIAQLASTPAPDPAAELQESMDLADLLDHLPDETEIFPDESSEIPGLEEEEQQVEAIQELMAEDIQELDFNAIEIIDDVPGEVDSVEVETEELVVEEVDSEENTLTDAVLGEELEADEANDDVGVSLEDEIESPKIEDEPDESVELDDDSGDADITQESEDSLTEEETDIPEEDTEEVPEAGGEDEERDVDSKEDKLTDEDEEASEANDSHLAYLTEPEQEAEESAQDDTESAETDEEVEEEPYGVAEDQCWQCGKEVEDEEFTSKNGRLYCSECLPEEDGDIDETDPDGLERAEEAAVSMAEESPEVEKTEKAQGFSLWRAIKGIFK